MLQIKYKWTVHNVSPHICFLQWMFAMQAPRSSWCLSLINMFSCEGSQCRSLAFTNGWVFWALAIIPDLWGWENDLDLLLPSQPCRSEFHRTSALLPAGSSSPCHTILLHYQAHPSAQLLEWNELRAWGRLGPAFKIDGKKLLKLLFFIFCQVIFELA